MTNAIHFGWWLVPAGTTLAAFGWARWFGFEKQPSADYSFDVLAYVCVYGAAAIVSLAAWLVWALVA